MKTPAAGEEMLAGLHALRDKARIERAEVQKAFTIIQHARAAQDDSLTGDQTRFVEQVAERSTTDWEHALEATRQAEELQLIRFHPATGHITFR